MTIFDELFASEGVKQVYGIVTEWLAGLDSADRKKIKLVTFPFLAATAAQEANIYVNKLKRPYHLKNWFDI